MRIYSSTDSGAPVLTEAAGSLTAVLTAVLKNGYGSKQAAGWDTPFDGGGITVFQARAGRRNCIQVDDSAATNTYFRAYKAMQGSSVGQGPYPLVEPITIVKSRRTAGLAVNWLIFASETAFYIVIMNSAVRAARPYNVAHVASSLNAACLLFGDLEGADPSDDTACVLIGNIRGQENMDAFLVANHSSNSTLIYTMGHVLAGSKFVAETRLDDVDVTFAKRISFATTAPFYGGADATQVRPQDLQSSTQTKVIRVSNVYVDENRSTTANKMLAARVNRGMLPGLLVADAAFMHPLPLYKKFRLRAASEQYYMLVPILIRASNSGGAMLLIRAED